MSGPPDRSLSQTDDNKLRGGNRNDMGAPGGRLRVTVGGNATNFGESRACSAHLKKQTLLKLSKLSKLMLHWPTRLGWLGWPIYVTTFLQST